VEAESGRWMADTMGVMIGLAVDGGSGMLVHCTECD
jgi:hypothetical protein